MSETGARRYQPEAGLVVGGKCVMGQDLLVRDGRIVGQVARTTATPGYEVVRVRAMVAPGLVDMHTHGAFGVALESVDPTTEDRPLDTFRQALWAHGVAAFVASLPSLTPAATVAQLDRLAPYAGRVECGRATLLGVHLEGPYLAPAKRGAHPPENLRRPDPIELARWLDRHPGLVRMVTLAPELPGAGDLVRVVRERGAVAALGHSEAGAEAAEAAFALGARHATHLWNAMPALGHRAPGLVGAMLAAGDTTVEMILDGHHLDPRVAALTLRAVGPNRFALVTDAMAAAGLGDGQYRLGDLVATVRDGVARAPDGVLAGSTLLLEGAVRHVVAWGLADAARAHAMASSVPARIIQAEGFASVAPGAVAALIELDADGGLRPLDASGQGTLRLAAKLGGTEA